MEHAFTVNVPEGWQISGAAQQPLQRNMQMVQQRQQQFGQMTKSSMDSFKRQQRGTHRNSPIDARNYIAVQSPDKKIVAWIRRSQHPVASSSHPAYDRLR
jgi:hypothetical protein